MAPDDDDLTFTVHLDGDDPDVHQYLNEQHGSHGAPQGGLADPLVIVREALAQPLPCPVCSRTEPCRCLRPEGYSKTAEQAALVVAALRHFGHLADEPEPPGFDPVGAARVLADRSGFARYEGRGFATVMQSDADVDLAAHYATKRVHPSEVDMIRSARAGLLEWRKATPQADVEVIVSQARESM